MCVTVRWEVKSMSMRSSQRLFISPPKEASGEINLSCRRNTQSSAADTYSASERQNRQRPPAGPAGRSATRRKPSDQVSFRLPRRCTCAVINRLDRGDRLVQLVCRTNCAFLVPYPVALHPRPGSAIDQADMTDLRRRHRHGSTTVNITPQRITPPLGSRRYENLTARVTCFDLRAPPP